MRWLVVVERRAAAGGLAGLFDAADASPTPGAEWIDLGPDEMTIEVDGPADLPARLDSARGVREVYPSSEPTPYR